MGKIFSTDIEIFMEGRDKPLIVTADQRDYAAWEAFPGNVEERDLFTLRLRFLGWHAGKRGGQVAMAWDAFNEELCIQAMATPEAESDGEDEEGLDPGRS